MQYAQKVFCPLLAGLVLSTPMSTVQAKDSVEIYGVIGLYGGSIKRAGETGSSRAINGGGLQTSFLGFRGQEDLGNGLKALFSLESFFRPDTGEQGRNATDPLFSRNAWLGLDSAYGRVSFGRQTNPTYAVMSQLSPFGASVVFSPLTVQSFVLPYGRNILGDSVWNNVVKYSTHNLNGFQGSLLYGFGEVADKRGYANTGAHATYRAGKFMGALSVQRVRMNVTTALAEPQLAWLAGATYDFGPVKLHGSTVRTSIDGGAKTRLLDLGLTVPVSASGQVLLETAQSRIESSGLGDIKRTTTSIGYDHRLSKRTDIYAVYSRDDKTALNPGNSVALGIRHAF